MRPPLWLVALIRKGFPARYRLARSLKRFPRLARLVQRFLFEGDELLYLPRRVPVAREVPPHEQVAVPGDVADHFIRSSSYRVVMNECICRRSEGCTDYPTDLGCLFLGDGAKSIHPKLGRPVSVEEALEHTQRARDLGLVQLIGRNLLDTRWTGASPVDRLMTLCSCCPCCCLWRMLPDLPDSISSAVQTFPGVTVTVTDACIGCGTCTEGICFVDAIGLTDGRAQISEACRGCGRCVEFCPSGAIDLKVGDPDAVDAVIRRLSDRVDVT